MNDGFVSFPRLPSEIRRLIWSMAFDEWSMSCCEEDGLVTPALLFIARRNVSIARSCKEAFSVQRSTCSLVRPGWINFSHYALLLNSMIPNIEFVYAFGGCYDVLSNLQHLVFSPRSFQVLDTTVRNIKVQCSSLRHLVLVGPWFSPVQMHSVAFHTSFLLWRELRPLDVPIQSLLDTLNEDADVTENYVAELSEALRLEPRHRLEFARTICKSLKLTLDVLSEFPDPKPRLHLRSRAVLCQLPYSQDVTRVR
ncbi:hypothetical protein GQ602_005284 [Ophiocordyceps camponoti-floridani]|uniref:Uncharacterized protein n=1 Tax=Ophiocordyceps camponoti-floridani TaxID=2030778 RepID=A0A8H4Q5H1_9HYPO|nr:hypothetical protein GQ602_005284 [Ophiocordyceps camponoti-floridani]